MPLGTSALLPAQYLNSNSNKMEHFSYKGGHGICDRTHIETFKRRVEFGYR